jgi:hypothetical protein
MGSREFCYFEKESKDRACTNEELVRLFTFIVLSPVVKTRIIQVEKRYGHSYVQ